MWNLLVFAVIGLLAGAAARLLYPGRRSTRILGTMLIGIVGGVVGGVISWIWWPVVEGEFHTGNLILSVLGAMMAIVLWAGVAYKRNLRRVQEHVPMTNRSPSGNRLKYIVLFELATRTSWPPN